MTITLEALPKVGVYVIALRAGGIAIVINTVMLLVADEFGLTTARGGLLKLFMRWALPALTELGYARSALWLSLWAKKNIFQMGFHVAVGLIMAVVLVGTAARYVEKYPYRTGLIAAIFVWLVNALLILPNLAEGFAGERNLSAAGIIYFAVAHTVFFLVLSWDACRRLRNATTLGVPEHADIVTKR